MGFEPIRKTRANAAVKHISSILAICPRHKYRTGRGQGSRDRLYHLGLEARRYDDGSSSGRHDFWLERDGGSIVGALEVTSHARQTVESLEGAVERHGRRIGSGSTGYVALPISRMVPTSGRSTRSRHRVAAHLRSLESLGHTVFVEAREHDSPPEIQYLAGMGIRGGRGIPVASDTRAGLSDGKPRLSDVVGGRLTGQRRHHRGRVVGTTTRGSSVVRPSISAISSCGSSFRPSRPG